MIAWEFIFILLPILEIFETGPKYSSSQENMLELRVNEGSGQLIYVQDFGPVKLRNIKFWNYLKTLIIYCILWLKLVYPDPTQVII